MTKLHRSDTRRNITTGPSLRSGVQFPRCARNTSESCLIVRVRPADCRVLLPTFITSHISLVSNIQQSSILPGSLASLGTTGLQKEEKSDSSPRSKYEYQPHRGAIQ